MAESTTPQASAAALLRRPKLWLVPTILTGLLALLLSLLYMGGIVNPNRDLHDLPIALVNSDTGKPPAGQKQNLGTQVAAAIGADTAGGKAEWRTLTRAQAQEQLDSGKVYGALVIPADFTDSVTALTTTGATQRPVLTVLTNPGKEAWAPPSPPRSRPRRRTRCRGPSADNSRQPSAPGRIPPPGCCSPTR